MIALYVDDILLSCRSDALLKEVHASLGMDIARSASGIKLSLKSYIEKVLKRFGMDSAKPQGTPFAKRPGAHGPARHRVRHRPAGALPDRPCSSRPSRSCVCRATRTATMPATSRPAGRPVATSSSSATRPSHGAPSCATYLRNSASWTTEACGRARALRSAPSTTGPDQDRVQYMTRRLFSGHQPEQHARAQ